EYLYSIHYLRAHSCIYKRVDNRRKINCLYDPTAKLGGSMNKNVLILGASGDIGNAIALELAVQGYQLILHYHRNKHTIDRLHYLVPEEAILQTVQANLADTDSVHQLCEEVAYHVDAIVFVSG